MDNGLKLSDYLPPEFDITKYNQCGDFGALAWLSNIAARINFGGQYNDYQSLLGYMDNDEIFNYSVELNIKHGGNRLIQYEDKAFELLQVTFHSGNIKTLTLLNALALSKDASTHAKTSEFYEWYFARKEGEIPSSDLINTLLTIGREPATNFSEHGYLDYSEFVSVDLAVPDEILLKEFSKWLSSQRERLSVVKPKKNHFSKAKFRRWHESRSLAYLDLKQWNEKHGRNLPHAVAGEILFSDYSFNDTRNRAGIVADTTQKNAAEMLDLVTTMALMSQVLLER